MKKIMLFSALMAIVAFSSVPSRSPAAPALGEARSNGSIANLSTFANSMPCLEELRPGQEARGGAHSRPPFA